MRAVEYICRVLLVYLLCYNSFKTDIELRPESDLVTGCYSFPERDYGKSNNIRTVHEKSPYIVIQSGGEQAIDFTLRIISHSTSYSVSSLSNNDNNGNVINLRKLLLLKPVVLLWGHGTCPAFRGYKNDSKFLECSYLDEQQFIDDVKDSVTIIHMISSEPHPMWPYTNFDSGIIKMNYWSTIKQPQNYEERLTLSVPQVIPLLHPKAILAIDDLDGVADVTNKKNSIMRNNPVWCSYANGARSAVLIGMSGKVIYTQEWFNRESLLEAVRSMIQEQEQQQQQSE